MICQGPRDFLKTQMLTETLTAVKNLPVIQMTIGGDVSEDSQDDALEAWYDAQEAAERDAQAAAEAKAEAQTRDAQLAEAITRDAEAAAQAIADAEFANRPALIEAAARAEREGVPRDRWGPILLRIAEGRDEAEASAQDSSFDNDSNTYGTYTESEALYSSTYGTCTSSSANTEQAFRHGDV